MNFRNIRLIENNFSGIFLLQISCSSIVICSGTYILAYVTLFVILKTVFSFPITLFVKQSSPQDNQFKIIVHIALIGYYIFDIFLTMYFGNLIILKSDDLRTSLYQSNWTQQSMKFRRISMILLERLRNPTIILVGKLFPLSLDTFTAVISLSHVKINKKKSTQIFLYCI